MKANCRMLILGIILVPILSGCQQYVVKVDSLRSSDAANKIKYVLFPGNKDTPDTELQYIEFSQFIHRGLQHNGFISSNPQEADIVIYVFYGIGAPQQNLYSYSQPQWGQTGISSSYTTGMVQSYGNTATYSGQTTYIPEYGITGYSSQVGSYVTYDRYLVLGAIDWQNFLRNNKQVVEVWKTVVTSTGSSNDLRKVFPVMVAAARPYFGKRTENQVTCQLTENDSSVREICGEAKP